MIENISNGQNDRMLKERNVLSDKFSDTIAPLTFRRMWSRGEMPYPIKLGGQNFWWESAIDRALELKSVEAAADYIKSTSRKVKA